VSDVAVIQRKPACACGGGCPRCKKESDDLKVQTKLAISTPGDEFEQEADRVADQVMRMPDPMLQRQCKGCADASTLRSNDEEEPQMQRQANGENGTGEVVSDFASRLGAGVPLDIASRAYFEPRFVHDFGNVRIHDGPQAGRAAASVQARAFTLGRDVVFAAGEHDPGSESGKRLLAHELTHVVQQSGSDGIHVGEERGLSPIVITRLSAAPSAVLSVFRTVGRLGCTGGTASAPADPRADLEAIDAQASRMAAAIAADLETDATTVRGGIPAAPSATLQSFIDHFGLAPASGSGFLNRLTGEVRSTQEIATSEEIRIVSRRFALNARIMGQPIHYACGAGAIELGRGCTDDCSSNDFDAFTCRGSSGIGLCPSFWTGYADDTARAAILIHEMFHMILGPTNPRGVGQIGDETQRGAGRNFNVAGCYEFIVDDIFATDSAAACPSIP
jgi:uncharacterized protein DUF4157